MTTFLNVLQTIPFLSLFVVLQTWGDRFGQEWTHHVVLNKDNLFHLYWTPSEKDIVFKIEVRAKMKRVFLKY